MRKLILLLAMHAAFATSILAQGYMPMTRTNNWLAAPQHTIGSTTPANWFQDLNPDELEVYVTAENTLVLVDRAPVLEESSEAYLRRGVHGLGGTHLSLVGEVDPINDHVLHGVYSGLIGGTAVLMDQ